MNKSYSILVGGASQVVLGVRNLPANARNIRDAGLIPKSERSLEGRHGNPLQYSCLENPVDRGAWWAAVHGVASAYLRLLICLLEILIPACASSSLAFHMMYSVYKLNKQGDNIQP